MSTLIPLPHTFDLYILLFLVPYCIDMYSAAPDIPLVQREWTTDTVLHISLLFLTTCSGSTHRLTTQVNEDIEIYEGGD